MKNVPVISYAVNPIIRFLIAGICRLDDFLSGPRVIPTLLAKGDLEALEKQDRIRRELELNFNAFA